MVDFVKRGLAGTNMIGDVFDVGKTGGAGGHVHIHYIEADAMPFLKHIGGGQDFNVIFSNFAGNDRLLSCPGKLMPGFVRFCVLRIKSSMRSFKPAAGQLSFR